MIFYIVKKYLKTMGQIKLWEIVPIVIIAGAMAFIVLPAMNFVSLSNFYKSSIIIHPEPPIRGTGTGYWDFPISITNNSYLTMRNVIAFITIEYDQTDIREDPDLLSYKAFPPGQPLSISWTGAYGNEDKKQVNIETGATAILHVFRRHLVVAQTRLLQLASENDLISKGNCSLLLDGSKEYDFAITVIADNIFPITEQYRFNLHRADMLERENSLSNLQGPALIN